MAKRRIYDDGGVVANAILQQIGGSGRLRAMTGAYNFIDLKNGLSFRLKNSRANFVKIMLNSMDLYDVEVGRIRGDTYKVVAEQNGLYNDQLKKFIEQHTGLYLSLAKGGKLSDDDVYGDKFNEWHDTSFERGDGHSFAYSTKERTVMYGADLENGGYFASYTTNPNYMEFAPEKSYDFKTIEEAKKKAEQLLSDDHEIVIVSKEKGKHIGKKNKDRFYINASSDSIAKEMAEERWRENDDNSNLILIEVLTNAEYRKKYLTKMDKGGTTENLEKELHKLQRDLNSSSLSSYWEGVTSEKEIARQKERETKLARFNEVLKLLKEKGSYAKGGMVVTKIKDIPNLMERVNEGKITYRGLGMGKKSDDFYDLAGTSGSEITVDKKKYFITDEEFNTFNRGADGKLRVRFDAPFRKFGQGGRVFKLGDKFSEDFDYIGMLKMGLKSKTSWGVPKLRKLYDSFEDVNYAAVIVPLWDAMESLKKGEKAAAENYIKKFHELVTKQLDNIDMDINFEGTGDNYSFNYEIDGEEFQGNIIISTDERKNDTIEWDETPEDWEEIEPNIIEEFYKWKSVQPTDGKGINSLLEKYHELDEKKLSIKLNADLSSDEGVIQYRNKILPIQEEIKSIHNKLYRLGYDGDVFAKGGKVRKRFDEGNYQKFGNENSDLVNFSIDDLDPYELSEYNRLVKHSSKEDALQILINNVEQDYSQLSPNLSEIAQEQYPSYANGGKIEDDKLELIVIDEHTLAYRKPNSDSAQILHASILKGSPNNNNSGSIYIGSLNKVRLATEQDFDSFRVVFDGYKNDPIFIYDTQKPAFYETTGLEKRHDLQYGDSFIFKTEREAIKKAEELFERNGIRESIVERIKVNTRKKDLVYRINDTYPLGERVIEEPISYANGGEIANACVEEVVKIINTIQKVKDWYVADKKLIVVFEEELMIYSADIINHHLQDFPDCHDIIEPYLNLNYKEDFKSIYFNLKKDVSVGKYANGGIMGGVNNDRRKIRAMNFSEKIENSRKFKELIQKAFNAQKEDDAYPFEFIESTALGKAPIVLYNGKNWVSGQGSKGAITHFPFLNDDNFIEALKYIERPKITRKRFSDGGNIDGEGDIGFGGGFDQYGNPMGFDDDNQYGYAEVGQVYLNTTTNKEVIVCKSDEKFISYHTNGEAKSYRNTNSDTVSKFEDYVDNGTFVLVSKMKDGGSLWLSPVGKKPIKLKVGTIRQINIFINKNKIRLRNEYHNSGLAIWNENATIEEVEKYRDSQMSATEQNYANGGNVVYLTDYKNDKKNYYFRRYSSAIGGFGWIYNKNYNEGVLYPLDDFDKTYYAHIQLKKGEYLFRYKSDRMTKDAKYLIKINLEKGDKGLLYFLDHDANSNDNDKNPVFETKGVKAEYLVLENGKFADGGKVEGSLKQFDYVWNAVGKKLSVQNVTADEYYLSAFMQKGSSPFSKEKVNEYIKTGEWTLNPKLSKIEQTENEWTSELIIQPDFKYKNTANSWLDDNNKESTKYKLACLLIMGVKNPDEVLKIDDMNRYSRLLRSLDKIKGESEHEGHWRTENYSVAEAEKWTSDSLNQVFYVHRDKLAEGGRIEKKSIPKVKVGDIITANTGVKVKVVAYDPKFGGRVKAERLDEYATGVSSPYMRLSSFTFSDGGTIKKRSRFDSAIIKRRRL